MLCVGFNFPGLYTVHSEFSLNFTRSLLGSSGYGRIFLNRDLDFPLWEGLAYHRISPPAAQLRAARPRWSGSFPHHSQLPSESTHTSDAPGYCWVGSVGPGTEMSLTDMCILAHFSRDTFGLFCFTFWMPEWPKFHCFADRTVRSFPGSSFLRHPFLPFPVPQWARMRTASYSSWKNQNNFKTLDLAKQSSVNQVCACLEDCSWVYFAQATSVGLQLNWSRSVQSDWKHHNAQSACVTLTACSLSLFLDEATRLVFAVGGHDGYEHLRAMEAHMSTQMWRTSELDHWSCPCHLKQQLRSWCIQKQLLNFRYI